MTWWGWALGYAVLAAFMSMELAARDSADRGGKSPADGTVVIILLSIGWPLTLLASGWYYGFEWRREQLMRPTPPKLTEEAR